MSELGAEAFRVIEALIARHESYSDALEESHFDALMEDPSILSPFLPTNAKDICDFLSLARVRADDCVLDVGCGDGRVLLAARAAVGCGTVGVDVEELCIDEARRREAAERAALPEGGDSEWICGSFMDEGVHGSASMRRATVAFLYCYPTLLREVEPIIRRMLGSPDFRLRRAVTVEYHFTDTDHAAEAADGKLRIYEGQPSPAVAPSDRSSSIREP